jgi:hypothetical protein
LRAEKHHERGRGSGSGRMERGCGRLEVDRTLRRCRARARAAPGVGLGAGWVFTTLLWLGVVAGRLRERVRLRSLCVLPEDPAPPATGCRCPTLCVLPEGQALPVVWRLCLTLCVLPEGPALLVSVRLKYLRPVHPPCPLGQARSAAKHAAHAYLRPVHGLEASLGFWHLRFALLQAWHA